jgi:lipoyl(octanoyl) transferase
MNRPKVKYHPLGSVDYKEAWDFQESLFNAIISSKQQGSSDSESHLITCEHPHVFTLGKSGKKDHLLADEESLKSIDARFYPINRGGGHYVSWPRTVGGLSDLGFRPVFY